jgi:hypothetical protein
MKLKLLCLIAGILATIGVRAEIAISDYTNSHGESFRVSLLTKNDKPYRISIECETKDKSKGEIWIKPSDVQKFQDALISLKAKYEEWDAIAKKNNVAKASKDMPIKFPKVELVWGHTTTFFANDSFKAKWVLSSPVEFVVCIANVKASNNRFANETFILRFYCVEDVQNLIDALSQDKIDASMRTSENSNLFN